MRTPVSRTGVTSALKSRCGIVRRLVFRRRLRGVYRLICRWRRWSGVTMPQKAPQEACRMRRLLYLLLQLLDLFLGLLKLRMGLFQSDVLYKHTLRKDINRILIGAETAS